MEFFVIFTLDIRYVFFFYHYLFILFCLRRPFAALAVLYLEGERGLKSQDTK